MLYPGAPINAELVESIRRRAISSCMSRLQMSSEVPGDPHSTVKSSSNSNNHRHHQDLVV